MNVSRELLFNFCCTNCQTRFSIESQVLEEALKWRHENRCYPPDIPDDKIWCPICNRLGTVKEARDNE